MKNLLENTMKLESIIEKFADSKFDDANVAFADKHGYDLRYSEYNDHLEYNGYDIDDNEITLKYHEITPHDMPYGISITYTLDDLEKWYKGLRVEKLERILN